MEEVYARFIEKLLAENNLEKNVLLLTHFLSDYIPFDQLLYAIVNFREDILVPIMVVRDNEVITNHLHTVLHGIRFSVSLYPPNEVSIENNVFISMPETRRTFFLPNMHSFLITSDEYVKGEINVAFVLQSTQVDHFTEEHKHFLEKFRDVIKSFSDEIMLYNREQTQFKQQQNQKIASSSSLLALCRGLKSVLDDIIILARRPVPVLIQGETGVGKELVADSIQYFSALRDAPFLRINCAAITESLLESELFGHEKGAFTSASSTHLGYFEQASGGTLFLDEIGELSASSQAKLLRVLENNEIRRVGGTESIPVHVRLLFATCQNLEKKVQQGQFRQDLWFRINAFPLHVPPLRQRKEDIATLARYFYDEAIQKLDLQNVPPLTQEVLLYLYRYDWPGNVRELKHHIERCVLFSAGKSSLHMDLPVKEALPVQPVDITVQAQKKQIEDALQQCKGRIHGEYGAAKLLQIHPSTLRSRMKKLGIVLDLEERKTRWRGV